MRKKMALILVPVLILTAAGTIMAGGTRAPLSTDELKKTIGAGNRNTVVFFQNPQGGPCKIQNEILQKLVRDRKNNFNIASVSTMKSEDQKAFYDYGVRNLPTIVVVDKSGVVANYFPPGIQSYDALAAALDAIK